MRTHVLYTGRRYQRILNSVFLLLINNIRVHLHFPEQNGNIICARLSVFFYILILKQIITCKYTYLNCYIVSTYIYNV